MSDQPYLPDGYGLSPETKDLVHQRNLTVHLRLTALDGSTARGVCDLGLGELWTGIASEVTCSSCREWVHA